jgi:secretion/DNA translocation related CpaE-like protein
VRATTAKVVAMTAPRPSASPLLVTGHVELRDRLLRLCAATAVSPDTVSEPHQLRQVWSDAACVLVGADCVDAVAALPLPRREGVIVVSGEPATAEVWRAAVVLRAEQVVVVPDADGWLVDRLTDCVDGSADATLVAVIGARGGAGASTLSASLALTAARRGSAALLIDLDPLSGGLDLLVGCESAPGLRWKDVAATQGRVSAGALRHALPSADGLAVLSWGPVGGLSVDSVTVATVLAAGRRGCDLVVLDLPRQTGGVVEQVARAVGTVLLVCTADVRSTAGARRLVGCLQEWCQDIAVVVRRSRGDGLSANEVAATLGLPLSATLTTNRSVARDVDDGLGPLARGKLERECSLLLTQLLVPERTR